MLALMLTAAVQIPVGVVILLWRLGFAVHPRRVGFACSVAGPWMGISIVGDWLVYRFGMRHGRELQLEDAEVTGLPGGAAMH